MNPIVNLTDRALKVLVILLLAGQPLSLKAIKAIYKKPVGWQSLNEALYELTHEGLIARLDYRGEAYVAMPHARQMILGETSAVEVSLSDNRPPGRSDITKVLQTSATEVSNLYHRGLDAPLEEEEGTDLPEKDKRPLLPLGQDETSPVEVSRPQVTHRPEVLAALNEAQIRDPARARLAALAHVTPELIQAHVADCETLGLAIYRIEHNFRPPKSAEAYDYLDWVRCRWCKQYPCQCPEEEEETP